MRRQTWNGAQFWKPVSGAEAVLGALGRIGQAGKHRCYATGSDQAPGPRWLMASGWNLVGGLTLREDRGKEGESSPSSHCAASQMRALLAHQV